MSATVSIEMPVCSMSTRAKSSPAACSRATIWSASSGAPGAGYCKAYKARGKPPKSCTVSGRAAPVTRTPRVIQCGDTTTTARGLPSVWPRARSCGPARPGSRAKVGEPGDTKTAGQVVVSAAGEVVVVGFMVFPASPHCIA